MKHERSLNSIPIHRNPSSLVAAAVPKTQRCPQMAFAKTDKLMMGKMIEEPEIGREKPISLNTNDTYILFMHMEINANDTMSRVLNNSGSCD